MFLVCFYQAEAVCAASRAYFAFSFTPLSLSFNAFLSAGTASEMSALFQLAACRRAIAAEFLTWAVLSGRSESALIRSRIAGFFVLGLDAALPRAVEARHRTCSFSSPSSMASGCIALEMFRLKRGCAKSSSAQAAASFISALPSEKAFASAEITEEILGKSVEALRKWSTAFLRICGSAFFRSAIIVSIFFESAILSGGIAIKPFSSSISFLCDMFLYLMTMGLIILASIRNP